MEIFNEIMHWLGIMFTVGTLVGFAMAILGRLFDPFECNTTYLKIANNLGYFGGASGALFVVGLVVDAILGLNFQLDYNAFIDLRG